MEMQPQGVKARVTELYYEGYTASEIYEQVGHRIGLDTIRVYVNEVMRSPDASKRKHRTPMVKPGPTAIKDADTTPEARSLGGMLQTYRLRETGLQPAVFCDEFDFANPQWLRRMESGSWDFRMSEVRRLSGVLGTSVGDIYRKIADACDRSDTVAIAREETHNQIRI
jgi:hypothetical protein